MTSTKHTPGPWIEVAGGEIYATQNGEPCGDPIAIVQNAELFGDPDARLIAEAPAMLEALRYLLQQTIEQDERYSIGLTEGEQDAAERARAILARIDGEAR